MLNFKPKAPTTSLCPFLRQPCVEDKCRMWTHLRGQNPQTGQEIDKFGCSIEFIPILLVEHSKLQYSTGAAIENFRNEMVKSNETNMDMITHSLQRASSTATKLLPGE